MPCFFLHNVFNTQLDFVCPSLALAASIDTSGHAGYHGYTIIDQFIASITRENHLQVSSLCFKQGFDVVTAKAGEAITVLNHNLANARICK
jgi:hypothetical protein